MHFLRLASLATIAAGATADLNNAGCASTSGYDQCHAAVQKQVSACIAQANSDNSQVELLACTCQEYVNTMNCYAANCWNRVWECAYQDYVVGYFQTCADAKLPVPYFPIPDNHVVDACSCNLGKVFLGMQSAIQQTAQCSNNAGGGSDAGQNLQQMQGCSCCEISGALSSIVEICPNTDPTLIGFNSLAQLQSNLNAQFSTCGPYLQEFPCASKLGYSINGVSTYLQPDDPLQTGTATLSNGPGEVSSPASGSVFTWTNQADGTTYTVTAAGVAANNGNPRPTGSGSAGGSESSGSSAATASTPLQSGGETTTTSKAGALPRSSSSVTRLPLAILPFALLVAI